MTRVWPVCCAMALAACAPDATRLAPAPGAGGHGASSGGAGGEGAGGEGPTGGAGGGGLAPGSVLWVNGLGRGSSDFLDDLACDSNGATFIVGQQNGPLDFDGIPVSFDGASDGFVAQLGPTGNVLGAMSFGGVEPNLNQYADLVAVAPDGGVVVAGRFTGSIKFGNGAPAGLYVNAPFVTGYVAKFDADGEYLWAHKLGSETGTARPLDLDIDDAGYVYIVGHAAGNAQIGVATTGGADDDLFLARFDPGGSHQWTKRVGDAADQTMIRVAVADDEVIVAGPLSGTINWGGDDLSDAAIFLARFDKSGTHLTSAGYGTGNVTVLGVDAMSGAIALTGNLTGTLAFASGPTLEFEESGVYAALVDDEDAGSWVVGSEGSSIPVGDIAVDARGSAVAWTIAEPLDIGGTTLEVDGAADIAALFLDPTGAVTWAERYGDEDPQFVRGIALCGDRAILGGDFAGKLKMGDEELLLQGGRDLWVAALQR